MSEEIRDVTSGKKEQDLPNSKSRQTKRAARDLLTPGVERGGSGEEERTGRVTVCKLWGGSRRKGWRRRD